MERFVSKIKKSDGCWLWTSCKRGITGYGAFRFNGKVVNSHRMAYELFIGKIPEGMLVCHKCDNKMCVNPDHLFLGTERDNYYDAVSKGRVIFGVKGKSFKKPRFSVSAKSMGNYRYRKMLYDLKNKK